MSTHEMQKMSSVERRKSPLLATLENDKRLKDVVVVFGFRDSDADHVSKAAVRIKGRYKNVLFEHYITRLDVEADVFDDLSELCQLKISPIDDALGFVEESGTRFTVRVDNIDDFITHLENMNNVEFVEYDEYGKIL